MLTYDKKQIAVLHRWLLPAVLFVFIILIFRLDLLVETLKQKTEMTYGWTLQFVLETLQTDAALLAAPVLCTFPFSSACIDEMKSGMLKNILYRTDKRKYMISKAVSGYFAGMLTLVTAVLLVCLLFLPVLFFMEAGPEEGTSQYEAIRNLIGLACRYGCFGGLWSLTGMLMSLLTMNRFMAWIAPFIIDYMLIILHERYFGRLLLFYPKQWLVCTWEWPLKDAGVCLWLLLLSGVVFVLTMQAGRRMLWHVA